MRSAARRCPINLADDVTIVAPDLDRPGGSGRPHRRAWCAGGSGACFQAPPDLGAICALAREGQFDRAQELTGTLSPGLSR